MREPKLSARQAKVQISAAMLSPSKGTGRGPDFTPQRYGVNADGAMQYSARWARPRHVRLGDEHRRHRPARLLFPAPRYRRAAIDQSRPPGALAARGWPACARHRLSDALSRPVPRGFRALHRLHAGGAGRVEMADGAADARSLDRSVFNAVAGRRHRSRPFGPCAGTVGRSGRAVARGVAGAGAIGANDRGRSEPAWGMDPHRPYAVRSRPALLALADYAVAAADLVYPGGVGRGLVHAAVRRRLVPALCDGVGARRRGAVAAGCRRAYRGGHQAGLPRDSGKTRTHATHSRVGAGAGAVVDRDAGIGRIAPRDKSTKKVHGR